MSSNALVPRTLIELLPEIDNQNKRIVAGCTDVIVGINAGKLDFKPMIDISNIHEIKRIFEKDNKVYIGSNVPISSILENKIINENFEILIKAISTIGSPQIRNRATIGGNIQNASPSGDSILALTLLEAKIVLKSIKGEREIGINDYILGVGKTQLRNDEFIEYIVIEKKYRDYSSYFEKVGLRNAMVISISSIGMLYLKHEHTIVDIKIVYGAVAPKVVEIGEAEEFLKNKIINEENLTSAGDIIERSISPIDDIRASGEYRKRISKNLIKRLLEQK